MGIVESYALPFDVEARVTETVGDGDGYVEPGEQAAMTVVLTSYELGLGGIEGILYHEGHEVHEGGMENGSFYHEEHEVHEEDFLDSSLPLRVLRDLRGENTLLSSGDIAVTVSNAVLPDVEIGGASTSAPPFAFSISTNFPGNTDAEFVLHVTSDQGAFDWPLAVRIGNPYDYPPEIDAIEIEPGTTEAEVAWRTGIESTGEVRYRLSTEGTEKTEESAGMRTNHSVVLSGLLPGSNYVCRIVAVGTNGLTNVTGELSFRTHAYVYVYADSPVTPELGTVEAPFRSLQAAANAAKLTGDAIHVAAGVYTSAQVEAVLDLDGSDWALTIEGGYAPDFSLRNPDWLKTVLDGQRTRRGIRLDNGAKLTISGVTITHGQGEWGGGVHVRASRFDAQQCRIEANSSTNVLNDTGGGIHANAASQCTLTECSVNGNCAGDSGGIAVVSSGTKITAVNCLIVGNAAQYSGGGSGAIVGGEFVFYGCEVLSNSSLQASGGGMVVGPFSSASLSGSTISRNAIVTTGPAETSGGGDFSCSILCWASIADAR